MRTMYGTTMGSLGATALGLGWMLLPQQGWVGLGQLAEPQEAQVSEVTTEDAPGAAAQEVDLAICLDTSGSMEQLLEAAKQKIWAIVNDFALAKPMPKLRVALLSFGNDGHSAENGWVEILTPLTEDLDLVSQRLFERTTNGGTELVGRVVHKASADLDWSTVPGALKIIVVAGNESADQDQEIPFRDACARAIGRDIMVNAIYCGSPTDEIAPTWREVARLADGQFAAIEHQAGPVVVTTPYDDELANLSSMINLTYIPLGEAGMLGCSNQWAQDANASHLNQAAAATRAQTKGGGLYVANWDLVTACQNETVQLAEVSPEDLPEELRGKTVEELQLLVDGKAAERAEIQERIQALGVQRDAYVAAEMRKAANDPSRSFDFALRQAIRAQAESKGLSFPVPPPAPEQAAEQPAPAVQPVQGAAQQVQALAPLPSQAPAQTAQLVNVQGPGTAQQQAGAPQSGNLLAAGGAQEEAAPRPASPYRRPPGGRR